MGTYRSKGHDRHCVDCPVGKTTESISSIKKSQCNTPKCLPGQFLILSTLVIFLLLALSNLKKV